MVFRKNLYWQTFLNCDLSELEQSCVSMDNWTRQNISNAPDPLPDKFHIHDVYNAYNVFSYPLPGFYELLQGIAESFSEIQDSQRLWIKGWVNNYVNGEYHEWHDHKTHTWGNGSAARYPSWHGIFSVKANDTCTTYRIGHNPPVHIPWKNNQLVFVQNQDDWLHRTWPSQQSRITIAFNIMHEQDIDPFRYPNCWMPLLSFCSKKDKIRNAANK